MTPRPYSAPLRTMPLSHGLTHAQWLWLTAALAIILAVIPRAAAG